MYIQSPCLLVSDLAHKRKYCKNRKVIERVSAVGRDVGVSCKWNLQKPDERKVSRDIIR
jgi:hypothetical protein